MTRNSAEEAYLGILKRKSGQELLLMGFSMYETSKALMTAGILSKCPTIGEKELKIELFKRFYLDDFDPVTAQNIIKNLGNSGL